MKTNYTITLPFIIAQEVIEKIKQNSNKTISLIENKFIDGVLKTIIYV